MERFAGICVAFAFLGGFLIYDGCSRLANEVGMSQTPVNVTLDDLIAVPPRGHQYVSISGLTVNESFANVTSRYDSIGTAYVPLKSRSGSYAIATTNGLSAQFISATDSVTGIAHIGDVPREASRLLNCPGLNFNRALIIELNGKPPSSFKGRWGIIAMGIMMWVPLVGCFGYALWRDAIAKKRTLLVNSPTPPKPAAPATMNLPTASSEMGPLTEVFLIMQIVRLVMQHGNDFSGTPWRDDNAAAENLTRVLSPYSLATPDGRQKARDLCSTDGPLFKVANRMGWSDELAAIVKELDLALAKHT